MDERYEATYLGGLPIGKPGQPILVWVEDDSLQAVPWPATKEGGCEIPAELIKATDLYIQGRKSSAWWQWLVYGGAAVIIGALSSARVYPRLRLRVTFYHLEIDYEDEGKITILGLQTTKRGQFEALRDEIEQARLAQDRVREA